MCELSSQLSVSSRLEGIVQFLDEAAILATSFDTGVDQDCHDDDPPVFENVVTFINLPPLDQITICSESCSDHTSFGDVSSVTTDENDEINMESTPKKELSYPNPSLRTIFDRYWDKNRPAQVITTTAEESKMDPVSPLHHDDDTSSVNTCERTLRQSQEKTSTPPIRRRIFQGLPPTPDLAPSDRHCDHYPNKVQSDPCLLSKKVKPPCLRRSRFSVSTCSSSSPECRRASSSSSVTTTSVTFNPKVDVVVYRRPVEHYASKGWSDFFAS